MPATDTHELTRSVTMSAVDWLSVRVDMVGGVALVFLSRLSAVEQSSPYD